MGLKTLQAEAAVQRKELESTIGTFVKEAQAINNMVAQYEKKIEEIKKAYEEMSNLVVKANTAAKALQTHGIVQLDSMKRLIIVATGDSHQPHAVNLSELQQLESVARMQIENSLAAGLNARMDKIVGNWPSKIEVGMIFKKGDRVVEVSGPQTKSSNLNLKGNAALWHKVKLIKGYTYTDEIQMNLEELSPKGGWKFVKT